MWLSEAQHHNSSFVSFTTFTNLQSGRTIKLPIWAIPLNSALITSVKSNIVRWILECLKEFVMLKQGGKIIFIMLLLNAAIGIYCNDVARYIMEFILFVLYWYWYHLYYHWYYYFHVTEMEAEEVHKNWYHVLWYSNSGNLAISLNKSD